MDEREKSVLLLSPELLMIVGWFVYFGNEIFFPRSLL